MSVEEELPRAQEQKQQPEVGNQREPTDSETGRECQMHTHPGSGARNLDPPRHSVLGIFPVGFYPHLPVSKKPYRNPVLFLDALWKEHSQEQRVCRKRHKGEQKAGASPGDHQLGHSHTTETFAGPTEPRGTEDVLHPFIKQLDLQTSLFY